MHHGYAVQAPLLSSTPSNRQIQLKKLPRAAQTCRKARLAILVGTELLGASMAGGPFHNTTDLEVRPWTWKCSTKPNVV